jgi:hypothetical protein
MEITIGIIVVFLVGLVCYYVGTRKPTDEVRLDNIQILHERDSINAEIEVKRLQIADMEKEYATKRQLILDAEKNAETAIQEKKKNLEKEYQLKNESLDALYQNKKDGYELNILEIEDKLDSLKRLSASAQEAYQRDQDLQDDIDSYRLVISENDKRDIQILNNVKLQLSNPRILSMLIWQTFFKAEAQKKFAAILGKEEVCGIYKIENINNHKIYIGQSVNVKKRLIDHCKKCVGVDAPKNNKLYAAAQVEGLENFTFELLEQCAPEELDMKEAFFIDFYNSKNYGYNSIEGTKE